MQLCNEDYRWWWRSFLSSGSAALYLFGYSIWCVLFCCACGGRSIDPSVDQLTQPLNHHHNHFLQPHHCRYFVSKLDIDTPVSTFIYFTYMSMISIAFFLLTGSIGFFASLWFVRKIYGAIKVD